MIADNPQNWSEEEVLLAFSIEPTINQNTLKKYLNDFPEHAKALVACSIELMVDATRNAEIAATSENAVDRAWQRFQSVVSQSKEASVINPFVTLNPSDFKLLAKKLDINSLLLSRLRDRSIIVTTIPWRFVQRLATELGSTSDAIMDYLRSPPAMVSELSFRSDVKPAVTEQISFEKAIETSQLTPDQVKALKDLQD